MSYEEREKARKTSADEYQREHARISAEVHRQLDYTTACAERAKARAERECRIADNTLESLLEALEAIRSDEE